MIIKIFLNSSAKPTTAPKLAVNGFLPNKFRQCGYFLMPSQYKTDYIQLLKDAIIFKRIFLQLNNRQMLKFTSGFRMIVSFRDS